MAAGLNLKGSIIRSSFPEDDSVGGAVPSGTVVYPEVYLRLSPLKPTQALLEQGLETPTLFTGVIQPGNISLIHNDQLEVTWPPISSHYLKKFRIIGIANSTMNDPRAYIVITVRRIEKAHSNEVQ